MDLTPNVAPAIADAMAQLKQMIPEDLKQAHDALADLEDKLMAAASTVRRFSRCRSSWWMSHSNSMTWPSGSRRRLTFGGYLPLDSSSR